MKSFKHSGTYGDLIYSLALVKYFGGGEFYLHLNQIDWVAKHYYKTQPPPVHQGRMTEQDFLQLEPLLAQQDYVTKFAVLDPRTTAITHNLDRFRELFVGHPGNYVDTYAEAFGITDPKIKQEIRTQPWLTVEPKTIPNKQYVINRTLRWCPRTLSPAWQSWLEEGVPEQSVFVGTPEEHTVFERVTGWSIDYYPTKDLLELAKVIKGSEQFIGNQSVALSLAIGLGHPYACEARDDLPMERNECYFPDQGDYF
jgi:hypothetical protein